jgi:hypothetical protein
MNKIDYLGWSDNIRLANEKIELIVSTQFGPRIMRFGFVGGENLLHEDDEWAGKIGPDEKWVNYGGHRLWIAPEIMPLTYGPDNAPIQDAGMEGAELVVTSQVEPVSAVQKQLRITIAPGDTPCIKLTHVLTNFNAWPVEMAPWALSVLSKGGRVILPQEPYMEHGENDEFLPSRPLILWPFTDMSDSRWTWGRELIQLRSDASLDSPQKLGIYNTLGWGAFAAANGDLLVKFIDVSDYSPDEYPDMGSNFETFTKGYFQELETLGPLELVEPGESVEHVEFWHLSTTSGLPTADADLAVALEPYVEEAAEAATELGADFII